MLLLKKKKKEKTNWFREWLQLQIITTKKKKEIVNYCKKFQDRMSH
jgi:hypothetical protein